MLTSLSWKLTIRGRITREEGVFKEQCRWSGGGVPTQLELTGPDARNFHSGFRSFKMIRNSIRN
jgi:hypothetical protein